MAQNLAAVTTLKTFKANVRLLTGTLSMQESGLIETQLNDLVHFAIVTVRTLLGRLADGFYRVRKTDLSFTGTVPNYTASIAGLDVADINRINFYHATLGEIPVVSNEEFDSVRTIYAAADIGTTKGVVTIYLTTATPAVVTAALYSNIAAAPTAVEITFTRTPVKVIVDADTVDLPEMFIPFAIDIAVVNVMRQLGKDVPQEVAQRISAGLIRTQAEQLGLKITPQNA